GGPGGVSPPLPRARRRDRARLRRPRHRVRAGHHRPAHGARPLRPPEGADAARSAAGPPQRAGTRRCPVSFLAPLDAVGCLATAGRIFFHLTGGTPGGEVPSSPLMCLAPSPPRLTRRSRLDHLLLLALRATALGLLVLAFTRPFWRQAARLSSGEAERRRV